ncbi:MAG: D-2-hydroxyacid dehydrogenase [Clostridiaceae bacterium]|nr:D-2-hydroxyacid dehydrogenase [Eubacteriales bacterium]NLV48553.1 D-2-hydroxyacid dehydrogenase [Clostridiaceae bacterium]
MISGKTILVLLPLNQEEKRALEVYAPDNKYLYLKEKDLTGDVLQQCHVILGNIPPARLNGLKQLEWLQLYKAGVDDYARAGNFPPQAVLTNASGAYGPAIAEHLLAVLLMLQKNLHLYRDYQNEQRWQEEFEITAIEGSTTLVIGLGDIGTAFARRMRCLGSRVIGVRRKRTDQTDAVDALHTIDSLDEVLPEADIIAMALPGTPDTYQLINRHRLQLMKRTAILMNVGRGTSIDTEALCDILESGHLRGAALDVTDPEPLPASHRLWRIRNVIITPHISGGYGLAETRARVNQVAIDNFIRFVHGKPLNNVVDFTRGY